MSTATYFASSKTTCPVCGCEIYREELRADHRRLIVDEFTSELRYTYKSTEEFGMVSPLLYPITVCPKCFYAAFKGDFDKPKKEHINAIARQQNTRHVQLKKIIPDANFNNERRLAEGVASYYYAMLCYECVSDDFSPIFKQALCALRAAWLLSDLDTTDPNSNWSLLMRVFYRKARFLYALTLEQEETKNKTLPDDFPLGPDAYKDFGFEGVLYITSILELNWGPRGDPIVREQRLQDAKKRLSQIFGLGKSSKQKPSALLKYSQWLFNLINKEVAH